jgi:hypothetical protein
MPKTQRAESTIMKITHSPTSEAFPDKNSLRDRTDTRVPPDTRNTRPAATGAIERHGLRWLGWMFHTHSASRDPARRTRPRPNRCRSPRLLPMRSTSRPIRSGLASRLSSRVKPHRPRCGGPAHVENGPLRASTASGVERNPLKASPSPLCRVDQDGKMECWAAGSGKCHSSIDEKCRSGEMRPRRAYHWVSFLFLLPGVVMLALHEPLGMTEAFQLGDQGRRRVRRVGVMCVPYGASAKILARGLRVPPF